MSRHKLLAHIIALLPMPLVDYLNPQGSLLDQFHDKLSQKEFGLHLCSNLDYTEVRIYKRLRDRSTVTLYAFKESKEFYLDSTIKSVQFGQLWTNDIKEINSIIDRLDL
jgi:hypothetical protein